MFGEQSFHIYSSQYRIQVRIEYGSYKPIESHPKYLSGKCVAFLSRTVMVMHRWILSSHNLHLGGRYSPLHSIKVIIIPCLSYETRSNQHHILWPASCQTVIYCPLTRVRRDKLTVMMDDGAICLDFQLHDNNCNRILIRFLDTNVFCFNHICSWKSSFQLGIHN